jgi:hypothetical protein
MALLGELIVEYMVVGLEAMIAQARVFGDPEYCRRQDAGALAISHGVLTDKLTGIAATAKTLGVVFAGETDGAGDEQLALESPARASESADG